MHLFVDPVGENPKYPCGICNKTIGKNHRAIRCSICNYKVHIKCNKTDVKSYENIEKTKEACICLTCKEENLPFFKLTNEQFKLMENAINIDDDNDLAYSLFPSESLKGLFRGINEITNENSDRGETEEVPINCKYVDINSFKYKQNKNNFSLFHLNIASLSKHKTELETVLSMLNHKFDVIALTETKIKKGIAPIFDTNRNGYKKYSTPTESEKGGAFLYVNEDYDSKARKDLDTLVYKSKELESVFIEITNPGKKNTIIGCIYRHPCMDIKEFNEDYLDHLMEKLAKEKKDIYLTGDFNIDLMKTEEVSSISDFLDTLTSNMFVPHIISPTRITSTSSTLIDNIFSNSLNFMDGISGNLTISISDHLAQFLIIPKKHPKTPKKQNLYKRDTKNFDREKFILDLQAIEWQSVLEIEKNDPNISFNSFESRVNSIIDKYMPLRKLTKKELKHQKKPWISMDIRNNIRKRERLYKNFVNAKNPQTKDEYHKKYKELRNEIVTQCRESEKTYYQKYFKENSDNIKNTWKGIKSIINIRSKGKSIPMYMMDNNDKISDPTAISNHFNKYFSNIGRELQGKIFQNGKHYSEYLDQKNAYTFFITPTDKWEVLNIINRFDTSKACGPHSIPTDILHLIKDIIVDPLVDIINLSFTTGCYIENLKIAKVIPIYKEKGSELLNCNYRPISLLSNINKIIEKLMHERLYNFLTKHNVIYELQFGFRKKHSTTHALMKLTEDIRHSLDSGNFSCGVFIDLQKAFDTVDHNILLAKLEHYGVRGTTNEWFKSYLSKRKQFVSINGFISENVEMNYGVPQGSVLGPLLFLIYINDLHCAFKYSSTIHFADDTTLLINNKSLKQLQKHLNYDLRFLRNWLSANKISLNASKTELLLFHHIRKEIDYDLKIKLNGKKLIPAKYVKYLGIIIDSRLNWKEHVNTLSGKLARANGMLSKIRHYVPACTLKSIYYAIFSSLMTYSCITWGQSHNSNIKRIGTLQNKALRNINFATSRQSSNPLYANSEILKFEDNVKLQNFLYAHDSLKGTLPTVHNNIFELSKDIHNYPTKCSNQHRIVISKVNTQTSGSNSIKCQTTSFWNEIVSTFPEEKLQNERRTYCKDFLTKYFISQYSHS